jgi:hypothetical protein
MAITCAFCVQTNIITLDRIEHALGIEHHANAVAGTVIDCISSLDGCQSPDELTQHPVSHAHSGDTATNGMLASSTASAPIATLGRLLVALDPRIGPSVVQHAPERPPKA